MPYKAFYVERDDGDWDLVAVVADKDETDDELSADIETRIKQGFGNFWRQLGDYKVVEYDDPEFVQVWSDAPETAEAPNDRKLIYLEDREDDNPLVKCPVCGFEGHIMDDFSMLAAGFNGIEHGSGDDVNLQECGNCLARLEY